MSTIDEILAAPNAAPAVGSIDEILGTKAPTAGSGILRRVVGDSAVSLAKGLVEVPEALTGIADLATGGRAGKALQNAGVDYKGAKDILSGYYSPEQQAANEAVSKADGFFPTAKAMIQNPSTIAQNAIESGLTMVPGGLVSRGALAVGEAAGLALGKRAAIAAGALGEGATAAGQNAEQVRQEDPNGTLTPSQSAILAASGMLTGGISYGVGRAANKLGLGDAATMIAAGKLGPLGEQAVATAATKGIARKAAEGYGIGATQEILQSGQEQAGQNIAQGKPWSEGVGSAAAQGGLAGGLMEAVAAPLHSRHGPSHADSDTAQAVGTNPAAAPPDAPEQIAAPALPGDPIRDQKLPETGPLTRGVNTLIEGEAQAADAGAPVISPVTAAIVGVPVTDAAHQIAPENAPLEREVGTAVTGTALNDSATQAPAFDPTAGEIAPPQRATFATREDVDAYLSSQRMNGAARIGNVVPVELSDGTFSFLRKGEPGFDAAAAVAPPKMTLAERRAKAQQEKANGVGAPTVASPDQGTQAAGSAGPGGTGSVVRGEQLGRISDGPITEPVTSTQPTDIAGGKPNDNGALSPKTVLQQRREKAAAAMDVARETPSVPSSQLARGEAISGTNAAGATLIGEFAGHTSDGRVKLKQGGGNTHYIAAESVQRIGPAPIATDKAAEPNAAAAGGSTVANTGTGKTPAAGKAETPFRYSMGRYGDSFTASEAVAKLKELDATARQLRKAVPGSPTSLMANVNKESAGNAASLARKLRKDISEHPAVQQLLDAQRANANPAAESKPVQVAPSERVEPTPAERERLLAEMGARNRAKFIENAQQIADKTGDTRLLEQERARAAKAGHAGPGSKSEPVSTAPTGAAVLVQRQENARQRFIDSTKEQFNLSDDEAKRALDGLMRAKLVTLDPHSGQFQLKDGRVWTKDAMLRAGLPAATPLNERREAAKPKARKIVTLVRGSDALGQISRRLNGISTKLLPDLSDKVQRTRVSKTGKQTRYTTWDNPLHSGFGPLFREGGSGDLSEIARVLEEEGYIEHGMTERDPLAASKRAQEIVRAELKNGGSVLREGDADSIEAEMRRRQEMANDVPSDLFDTLDDADLAEAGYAGASADVKALTERLMADAEAAGIDTETLKDDATRATEGLTDDEYHAHLQKAARDALEALGQDREDARGGDAGSSRAGNQDRIETAGAQGEEAGLTLAAQTAEDLKAKTDREAAAAAADKAEQKRIADKEKADSQRDEFTLTGSDRPADVAAAAGQRDIFDVPSEGSSASVKASEPATGKVEDFGEKLEGARKFAAPSLRADLTDEALASQPLSKVWPADEAAGIEDPFIAAVATAARAEVPAKPRTPYKIARWVEKVKIVRQLAQFIVSGKVTKEQFSDKMASIPGLDGFAAKVDLMTNIDRSQWGRIGSVNEYPEAYRYEDGKQIPAPNVWVEIDGKRHMFDGAAHVADVLDRVNALLGTEAKAAPMAFEVRSSGNGFIINKQGDKEYRALKTFATAREARDYVRSNNAALVAAWDEVKARDNVHESDVRGDSNRPRSAENYRQGKDVTAEQFDAAFKFRGVQFGNWVGQGSEKRGRQAMLNQAYDALMDLANIVGVPPSAISLNGTLGLSFGARGKGNAAAHFEPGNLVINLTKTKGAGTLAHEWFHALDNYFSRARGGEVPMKKAGSPEAYRKSNYITYKPEQMYVRRDGGGTPMSAARLRDIRTNNPGTYYAPENWHRDPEHPQGVRPEIEQRFADLVNALDASPMLARAKMIDKGPDGYWSRIIERGARAFENYVISKMMEKGYHNDYLANVKAVEDFSRSNDRYPYLLPEEVKPIADAFDALFGEVKTRDGDNGNAVMFSRKPGEPMGARSGVGFNREKAVANLPESVRNDPLFRPESAAMRDVHARGALWESAQEFGKEQGFPPFSLGVDDIGNIVVGRVVHAPGLKALTKFADANGVGIYVLAQSRGATEANIPLMRSIGFEPVLGLGGYGQGRHSTTTIPSGHATFAYKPHGISEFMFSRTPEDQPDQSIERTQNLVKQVAEITRGWKNAPDVVVANDMQDSAIPAEVRAEDMRQRAMGASGDPQAFYHQGKVYLLSSQIGDADEAAAVLMHESLGHYGLRGTFGAKLGDILDRMARLNQAEVKAKAEQYGLDVNNPTQMRAAAEEVLASMAQTNPQAGWVRQAIAAIRSWMRDHIPGLSKLRLSDDEILRSYLLPARAFVTSGQAVNDNDPAVRFDRTQNNASGESAASLEAQNRLAQSRELGRQTVRVGRDGVVTPIRGVSTADTRAYAGQVILQRNVGAQPWTVLAQGDDVKPGDVARARSQAEAHARSTVPMFSRTLGSALTDGINNVKDVNLPADYKVGDLFNSSGRLNWWHKTVGTQHNLAERSPEFKRVYDAAQNFLNDTSYYATEAANLAPKILPRLDSWKDIAKSPVSAADTKALAAPVFEGTLTWGRDERGNAVKIADMQAAADKMTPEEKAREMLRRGLVSESVMKMWQGMPVDQHDAAVDTRYENTVLKAGVVWTDAELKSLFKLNDGQIELYREFRKATDRSLTNMAIADMVRFGGDDVLPVRQQALDTADVQRAAILLRDHLYQQAEASIERKDVLNDTAEKMIEKADRAKDLMDRGYAPLSRFGQYSLDVVHDGERVYFGLFETARERARMARQMAENYKGAKITQGTVSQEAYKLFAGVSPETLALFGDMLGLEQQGDDASSRAFQTYLKLAKTNRSAMKRLIERKGIAGFSEDAGRVLAGFVYSNARQTSTNLHMGEMTQAAADIPQEKGQLKDAAVRLTEYVKNPQEEAQGLRGLLFAQYLGGSVASAMVNALQPLQVTFPYLSQYGGIVKSAKQMVAATRDATKRVTGDKALDAALHKAEEDGIVSPQEVFQLMAQAQGRGTLQSGDGTKFGDASAKAANVLSRVQFAWGKVFGVAEQFNRRVTFIAAYRTAVEQKMADPAKFAAHAVAETQFTYSKASKPQWARGAIGGTLFTFKQYAINYVELLHRMATQGGPDGKKAALLALAVLFLMSGAGGLPGSDDLDDVIDGVMQRMGYNFSSKSMRRAFFADTLGMGDAGARFVEKGVSGLPGAPIDVAGRLGLGNLIPGTGLFTKKQDYGRDVAEVFGPAGDLASRVFHGAGQAVTGDVAGGVLTMSPSAIRNAAKAYDMANTGMYRDQNGKKVISTDGYDAISKAIGFQPNDVAKVQNAAFQVQSMVALNRMRAQEISGAWAKAIFEHDKDGIEKARTMLKDWNTANPESPIRILPTSIRSQVAAMTMTKDQRLQKAAPKAIKGEVARQLSMQSQ